MRKQLELNMNKGDWGGRRKGAGRKRKHSRGVAHCKREIVTTREPLHVNFKFNIPVRNETGLLALTKSIENARKYFHILHYSLQWNHIHLIVEAKDNNSLITGMRSFTNTFVKRMGKGSIQKERYHLHVLRSVKETKNAFRYVILNHIHHSKKRTLRADLFSSISQLNVREIAREYKVTIIKDQRNTLILLDQPSSWLGRKGMKPT
jgi:hypothetical protein